MEQKTFYKTLLEINLYPNKARNCLTDKRLTSHEKKILEAYLLIRNNQNSEAMTLMHGLAPSELPFVEAQRQLLIGLTLNNQSYFSQAEESIWKSIPTFKKLGSHYFHFMAHFNLCIVYISTRQISKMEESILAMDSIHLESELQEIRLLRCKFNFYSEIGDLDKAHEFLKTIAPRKASMPESDIISQLVCEFMFHVKQEDFDMCEKSLEGMKKFRKFHLSENYNYMKKLLEHLTKNTPIYAYHTQFASVPILLHQIKVIQALEEKNTVDAAKHWNVLNSISSEIYRDNFRFEGTKCLFSLCLEKHHRLQIDPLQFKIKEDIPKLDALISLLTEAKTPLQAGLIYELLWGEPPKEKDDLKKISRLAFRARTEKLVIIKFHKGAYGIEVRPSPKAKKTSY